MDPKTSNYLCVIMVAHSCSFAGVVVFLRCKKKRNRFVRIGLQVAVLAARILGYVIVLVVLVGMVLVIVLSRMAWGTWHG